MPHDMVLLQAFDNFNRIVLHGIGFFFAFTLTLPKMARNNTMVFAFETCCLLQELSISETTRGVVLSIVPHLKSFNAQTLTGVPMPVTASQPSVAGNPVVLQPRLEPCVISVNASLACW